MLTIRPGRWLLTIVGLFTAVGHWVADFDKTHIYNDLWPPHAKFHTAQGLCLSSLFGLLTIYFAWRRRGDALDNLKVAALFASLYYFTQLTALLVPNIALTDPQFVGPTPLPFGLTGPQPFMDLILFAVIAVAYAFEKNWMTRRSDLVKPPANRVDLAPV